MMTLVALDSSLRWNDGDIFIYSLLAMQQHLSDPYLLNTYCAPSSYNSPFFCHITLRIKKYLAALPMVTNNRNFQIVVLKMPAITVSGSPIIGTHANKSAQMPHF